MFMMFVTFYDSLDGELAREGEHPAFGGRVRRDARLRLEALHRRDIDDHAAAAVAAVAAAVAASAAPASVPASQQLPLARRARRNIRGPAGDD